jgi:HAD superfamily hydrolase (TIGR01490 family)
MNTNKLAIFDCCDTIVSFQTADEFVSFIRRKTGNLMMKKLESRRVKENSTPFFKVLDVFGLSMNKKRVASQLSGFSKQEVDDFAKLYLDEELTTHLINETLQLIKKYRDEGCRLLLLSGGYWNYINLLAKSLGFDEAISTHLLFKNGISTGRYAEDCMGRAKVKLLRKYLKENNFAPTEIVSVSDSKSDIPILSVGQLSIVISKEHQKWVEKFPKFQEVVCAGLNK